MSLQNIELREAATGASAKILAGLGFNCYQYRVVRDGRPQDVIWAAEGFAGGQERASGSGIPILFPFPGRIHGTVFEWEGRSYQLQEGDGRGNAIHGFVHERPWRVVEQSAARVVGCFHAAQDDPKLLGLWPADFRITAEYELVSGALKWQIIIDNPDDKPLPFGLGTHPYFCVPIGGGSAERCWVKLPVAEKWELKDMLVTGKRSPLPNAGEFQAGIPFAEMQFDDVFSVMKMEGSACSSSIHDADSGLTTTLEFEGPFREAVVYNPAHRQAVCIEPYTCAPDPFRLRREGIDGGLLILKPGQSLTCGGAIRCE